MSEAQNEIRETRTAIIAEVQQAVEAAVATATEQIAAADQRANDALAQATTEGERADAEKARADEYKAALDGLQSELAEPGTISEPEPAPVEEPATPGDSLPA